MALTVQEILDDDIAQKLAGTAAEYVWLLPLLPLLGFVINGLLSVLAVARTGPAARSRRISWSAR